jgi:hypothetical protein
MAHEKIALTARKVWFATDGEVIAASAAFT